MQQMIVPAYTRLPPRLSLLLTLLSPLSYKDRLNERENVTSDVIKKGNEYPTIILTGKIGADQTHPPTSYPTHPQSGRTHCQTR